jgi:NAD(P)-dependent dehydrogenase (short-subunit alcohol dehydrogenase family)
MNCTRTHTLVTGASTGIGRATALRRAAAGQHVYAGVRQEAHGDQLVRAAAGGEVTPLLLDVTQAGQVAEAAAVIGGHTPAGLDGLVNNAGYGLACPAELVPLDAFRRQLEVNVTGQLAVTQAMLPLLRQAAGRIVMVSTIGVRFNPPFAGPLDAAKAALTALADAFRQELAPWGIRVVLVEPADELDWPLWTCRNGHPRASIIPGHEVSGVVTALGPGTAGIAVGDEVFGLTDPYRDAAAAEYIAVEARNLAPKPRTTDHVHAAAVPRAGLTAWQALFDHGQLAKGQTWSSTARAARSGRRPSSWPIGPGPR